MTEAPSGFRHQTLAAFIEQLASAAPVPGGGSSSAIVGAFAAALVRMVVALSLGRPKYAPYEATLRRADEDAVHAVEELLSLADEDAAAYSELAAALHMERATAGEKAAREAAIRPAARRAALAPLAVLRACVAVAETAEAIGGRSNVMARSDVATAASLAEAAARGAAENVRINLPMTGDEAFTGETEREVSVLQIRVALRAEEARNAAAGTNLRDPEPEPE